MAEEEPPKINTFANDGSFLEMFKKKMEEQKVDKRTEPLKKPPSEATRVIPSVKPQFESEPDDSDDTRTSETEKKPVHKPYQEQQSAEDEATKSSAWKAYMAEVKSYEAKNCTDNEGFKRPLVK